MVELENLRGNRKADAVFEYVKQIHDYGNSTVIIEHYSEDDYWWEEGIGTLTSYDTEDACLVWTMITHPHSSGYGHCLALIKGLKATSLIPLYCIKSIRVVESDDS